MYRQPQAVSRTGLAGRAVAAGAAALLIVLAAGCGGAARGHGGTVPHAAGKSSPAAGTGGADRDGRLARGTTGGALFGGNNSLAKVAGSLGRKLAIVRTYYRIGEPFPTLADATLMENGSTLLVSLDTAPGWGPSYASIAAGRHDRTILAFLKAMNHAAKKFHLGAIYFSFEHEPDLLNHLELGSPRQFVRAWDHIHQLATAAHLNWNDGGRLHWVLILLHNTYASDVSLYWPGTGDVDIVAADGYNSYACETAKYGSFGVSDPTPAELFTPVVHFAELHGLPVFISEWGGDSSPPRAQSRFIRQMGTYLSATPQIAAAMYWNSGRNCNYRIDGHPASIAALAAMGQSRAMQGTVYRARSRAMQSSVSSAG
jgi:hypothetical protein